MSPNRSSRATYGIASTGKSGILSAWSSTPRLNGRKRPSNHNTCWICKPWLRLRRNQTRAGEPKGHPDRDSLSQFAGTTQISRPGPRTKDSALPDGNGTYMGIVTDLEGADN